MNLIWEDHESTKHDIIQLNKNFMRFIDKDNSTNNIHGIVFIEEESDQRIQWYAYFRCNGLQKNGFAETFDNGKLTVERILYCFEKALEVFDNVNDAHRWCDTPQRAFGGETPYMFYARLGTKSVEHLLGRIEHGIF